MIIEIKKGNCGAGVKKGEVYLATESDNSRLVFLVSKLDRHTHEITVPNVYLNYLKIYTTEIHFNI